MLLPQLSESMIGEQVSLQEFLTGFTTQFASEIPLKSFRPASSAVVYRTACQDWTPERFRAGIHSIDTCDQVLHTINLEHHTLIVVTARRVPLAWTDVESLFSWNWELYVVIWSQSQNLLFINCSTNAGEYRPLAAAVCGADVSLVRGQDVFKTFSGVTRLKLQNVGLTEQLGRNVRYTGRMGADVESGVPEVQRRRAVKSVLSGSGFERGEKVTVGASRKGRIWSHQRHRVDQLETWCLEIGRKLLDPAINPDDVLQGTLEAQVILQRPNSMPIGADWPEEIFTTAESLWTVFIDGQEFPLSDTSIRIAAPSLAGPLRFEIVASTTRAELELELVNDPDRPNYQIQLRDVRTVLLRRGQEGAPRPITEFFYDNPPVIWFADGSSLEGNQYVQLKHELPPYNRQLIEAWNWDGVNIRKESQGDGREGDSIQARVIHELLPRGYDVVFDDDSPGESADVVAVRVVGNAAAPTRIEVEFYHCKYSGGDTPGARVADLYELCGQVQKSITWMSSHEKTVDLFTHLMRRDSQHGPAAGRPGSNPGISGRSPQLGR